MKKLTTRKIRSFKAEKTKTSLQVLTCYDFQTAQMLNETQLDMILVGDSLGNVVLGYDTTVEVSLEEMAIFGAAVKRGALLLIRPLKMRPRFINKQKLKP